MSDPSNDGEERLSKGQIEDERETLRHRIHEWMELPLAILALIWAGLLVTELAVDLAPEASARVIQAGWAIWFIFAAMFFIELALAPKKVRYLRSNILPAISLVLPFVRIVRLVRVAKVFRSFSLVRLTLVTNRASAAAAELFSSQRLHYVLALTTVATLLGAAGAFFFERNVPGTAFISFGDSLWWAVSLITTVNVGYDPLTFEGRIVALLLRAFGMGVFGYLAGSIASYLVGRRTGEEEHRKRVGDEAIIRLADEVERLRLRLEHMEPSGREREAPQ